MRKVIKILFSVLSGIILAAIILPLLVGLMLYLPPVQNFVVKKAAGIVSRKLETTVSIDRIHLRPFNLVTIDGFYVEDYNKDTLLYVGHIDLPVTTMGIFRGNTVLGDVRLSDVDFSIIQEADGTSNFKKILEKLKRKEQRTEKKPFRLRASGVRIDNMSFRHNKYVIRPKNYGVNFDDLDISGFSLDTRNVSILGDSITLKINNISLRDKSGFAVNSLSAGRFIISGQGMEFDELRIVTPDSDVNMPQFNMRTGTWKGYKDFTRNVRMESEMSDTKVSFKTIAYFAQGLKEWKTTFYNVNGYVEGPVADMSGRLENVRVGLSDDTDITLRFSMKGIPDIPKTVFEFDVEHLHSDADDLKDILEDISRKSLGDDLIARIDKLGGIELEGRFKGTFSNFEAAARVSTMNGAADFDLNFIPTGKDSTEFAGNINIYDLGLGDLLAAKELGKVSVRASVDGSFGGGSMRGKTNAQVAKIEYSGYNYKDIALNGYFHDKFFKGNIGSNDPNIKFDFDGMLDFNDSVPEYDFDLRLFNADLKKLNISKRDSISVLKMRMLASATGATLDELNGRIVISDMLYVNHLDSVKTGNVVITGENDADNKSVAMRSSFADIDYRSRTSYAQVMADLRKVLHYYLPTLSPAGLKDTDRQIAAISDVKNFSLLNVNVKEANNVASIFVPGLIIAKDSRLSFMFNPDMEQLSLGASSDYIEYKNNFISKLEVNSRNQGDSINLFVRAEDVYASGVYLPNFSVIGALKENQINAAARIQDKERDFSALVGVASTLGRDSLSGIPQMKLRFTPSNVKSKGDTWNIYTRGITVDSTKIEVNNLTVRGQGQQLRIDGTASGNKSDTLHINLSRFALHPMSQLTTRMGYEVEGMASGHADLISAMKDGLMYARLNFDSVRVNNLPIPDALFESRWDFERERAGFMLSLPKTQDTVVLGYFRPTDGRYIANIKMEGINMAFLDPVLKGVLSNTSGSANADIRMSGVKKAMKFNGTIKVPELTTSVDYLKVPYTLTDGHIEVRDNVLVLDKAPLKDPLGHTAQFDMNINLNSLSNVIYKIGVRPDNLLVMNTTSRDNDMFYGRVFASGLATIAGDKRGVNMDITATTKGSSEFYMPLSDQATMGVSDIITFKESRNITVDSTNYLARKQMILERKNKVRKRTEKSNMNIRMALNVTPDVDFQLLIDPRVGDILRGRGYGSLTMNINPAANEFSMYGDYEIQEGSYQFTLQDVISKRFTLEQGSKIMWTGEPADALLDVTGVYKLKASLAPLLGTVGNESRYKRSVPVECRVILGDRLSQPSVMFNVSVPGASPEEQVAIASELGTQESMSTQFFFLLAANSFYPTSGVGSIGTSASSSVAFDFLANQISNLISNDKFDIGLRYRQGDNTTHSDEFNIDLSTQLFGNRLLLEVEGNYDAGNTQTISNRSSNITGDFYLTWLIDKSGNLRAKGFTRTIDRFDENQGLQESGIGIYYKEDFNSLSDIVRNFKERFSGRKRKEKRAAKKALKEQNDANNGAADNETVPLPVSTENGGVIEQGDSGLENGGAGQIENKD